MTNWNVKENDQQAYLDVCRRAAEDDSVFDRFKRMPEFTQILEHTSKAQGRIYKEYIDANNRELSITRFGSFDNDTYGFPITYQYDGKQVSPTTIQYIYVLGRIVNLFGQTRDKNVCEIGGGYGGQCLIMHSCWPPKSYSIIDLPEVCMLQSKYLSKFGIAANIYEPNAYPVGKTYDLVISNYALSEIREPLQTQYVRDILLNSAHGYITCNGPIHAIEDIRAKFSSMRILPDIEGERKENFIIVW